MSTNNWSDGDRRPTFVARTITEYKVTFVKTVIVKKQRVLLQQDNQQYGDSQKLQCWVLTDSRQTTEESCGHSETETTDGTV